MREVAARNLPVGISQFDAVIEGGQVYVDKTGLIFEMVNNLSLVFLARPRRFGKSLLVSTLKSLFQGRLELFRGLEIAGLWQEPARRVVTLNFAMARGAHSLEEFRGLLQGLLVAGFSRAGFRFDKEGATPLLSQLSGWLEQQPPSSLVLLIDEYDTPLTSVLGQRELFGQIRSELSRFYDVVKESSGRWRFLFITGITKFNKTSIFSALNNLTDITMEEQFGTLLGYTHEELERCFSPFVSRAASALGMSRQEVLDRMKARYDGFCFDGLQNHRVYNPWSVLNFLRKPGAGFENYWYESGGRPSVLMEYFKTHCFADLELYSSEKLIRLAELNQPADAGTISDLALMTQAGYLTLRSVDRASATACLGYPNAEVAESIASLYTEILLRGQANKQKEAGSLLALLESDSAERIVQAFNSILLSVNYGLFASPLREVAVVSLLQVFMRGSRLLPMIERPNAFGRSDLEVMAGARRLVFEVKLHRKGGDSAERLLEQAVAQMRRNRYGEDHQGPLLRLAMAFSEEGRRFVRWAEVPVETGS